MTVLKDSEYRTSAPLPTFFVDMTKVLALWPVLLYTGELSVSAKMRATRAIREVSTNTGERKMNPTSVRRRRSEHSEESKSLGTF